MAVAWKSSTAIFFPASSSPSTWRRARHLPQASVLSSASSSFSFQRYPIFLPNGRRWRQIKAVNDAEEYITNGDYDEFDEEEEEDKSLDLLARFLHNVFKNISRRVRKAVRSVLPVPIPSKLVGFAVDGILILAFLWILKAFLEVICAVGSMVFVSILIVRGVWSGIAYFQEGRFNTNDDRPWTGVQGAT
ncbi:uncharacterized protein LOC144708013 [Wolffia australiana]